MPRSKAKQAELDRRDETYHQVDVRVCYNCRFLWNRFGGLQCQIERLKYRNQLDHWKPVEPLGTCNLWEGGKY